MFLHIENLNLNDYDIFIIRRRKNGDDIFQYSGEGLEELYMKTKKWGVLKLDDCKIERRSYSNLIVNFRRYPRRDYTKEEE